MGGIKTAHRTATATRLQITIADRVRMRDPICRGPKSPQELAPLFPLARKSVAPASSGLSLDRSGWVVRNQVSRQIFGCQSFYPDEAMGSCRDSGLGTRDSGLGTRDSGLGTRDSGLGTRASGLGTGDSVRQTR